MENSIKIQKEELKQVFFTLINKIDNLNEDEIYFQKDLYWNINDEELYNVYEEPKNITIGSIKEDWDFLQKILTSDREIINYDFNKIANILRLIGEKI
ncbi:hypothetical protein ASG22_19970 [Chryseobacterium sp. Leaf405]|uniref:hypothetical protein n=1 Tax=Chryseobacterium sp. Leaf405 TaxID=1736367 RepID=UPI0006FA4761|nr:hypothetical protein [Chryseobacterium sp. Leaf405]KQT28481.1 hypothetical protein ASG22_19970 [Chryseobacterium sp. Leaf405]